MKPRFALDQNFPTPIVKALGAYIVEAELVSIRDIDGRLTEFDDWQLLLALHHDPAGCDGLITNDSSMLALERELAVLIETKLTLVVAEESGHDPIRATGLVLAHLPWIAKNTKREAAQVWRLRATSKPHQDPWTRAILRPKPARCSRKHDPANLRIVLVGEEIRTGRLARSSSVCVHATGTRSNQRP